MRVLPGVRMSLSFIVLPLPVVGSSLGSVLNFMTAVFGLSFFFEERPLGLLYVVSLSFPLHFSLHAMVLSSPSYEFGRFCVAADMFAGRIFVSRPFSLIYIQF